VQISFKIFTTFFCTISLIHPLVKIGENEGFRCVFLIVFWVVLLNSLWIFSLLVLLLKVPYALLLHIWIGFVLNFDSFLKFEISFFPPPISQVFKAFSCFSPKWFKIQSQFRNGNTQCEPVSYSNPFPYHLVL